MISPEIELKKIAETVGSEHWPAVKRAFMKKLVDLISVMDIENVATRPAEEIVREVMNRQTSFQTMVSFLLEMEGASVTKETIDKTTDEMKSDFIYRIEAPHS